MKHIQKILFPTDFSDTAQNAFRYCLRIADTYKASIELLHVIYPEYQGMDIPIMATKAMKDKAEAAKVVLQEFVDNGLAQVQAGYQFKEVPSINSAVEIGGAATVIADVVERDAIDLVIMGTRDTHSAFEKTFGSVTTSVIERVPCPVLVIPEEAELKKIDIIAYATELEESEPYHIWKASQMLEPFHPILRIVHIGKNQDSTEKMGDLEDFFTQNAPALQVTFHNVEGNVVIDKLEEFSETYDIDVMIMYAPHHNFWQRIFQQSTTKRMALQTKIPVLFYRSSED